MPILTANGMDNFFKIDFESSPRLPDFRTVGLFQVQSVCQQAMDPTEAKEDNI